MSSVIISTGLTAEEFLELIKGTYTKISDKELDSLPFGTHLRYYITYFYSDGTSQRVFKKGGYFIKATKTCVIFGNVPDASLKRRLKKKGEINTDFEYFTWAVNRNPQPVKINKRIPIIQNNFKITWFRKYTIEELAAKYRRLKQKYKKLKESRGRQRSRSRDSVSSRSTIYSIT